MTGVIQTINFDNVVDKLLIIPDKYRRTADFIFGKYTVNLDLRSACCEKYYIYLNGKVLPFYRKQGRYEIPIEPSTSISFTFNEKNYREHKDWCYQKNSMVMRFSGGDRVCANRDEQWCGNRANIYTRCVYLDYDDESRFIGMV